MKPQTSRRVLRAGLEKLEKQNKALQELCAKQRLNLDDATRDAAQAGWYNAPLVYEMQMCTRQQELRAKQRLDLNVATRDAAQAAWYCILLL